jgi:hypothetical protein
LHVAAFGKRPVGIAINLENAREAGEMSDRPLGLAIGCVDSSNASEEGGTKTPL